MLNAKPDNAIRALSADEAKKRSFGISYTICSIGSNMTWNVNGYLRRAR